MVLLVFLNILQLPHTVILSSEKLTHPIVHWAMGMWGGEGVHGVGLGWESPKVSWGLIT